jgi:vitamin B12 transporter
MMLYFYYKFGRLKSPLMKKFLSVLLILVCHLSFAQELLDTVVVSAAAYKQSLLNSNRNVQIITSQEIEEAPVNSVAELLDFVTGIDAQQRGIFGTQTDLSIRGGTFEQVLVLVNGIRLSDPQTGHHLMNLPFALNDIERIEVLLGGASYIFGANSFSGAINIITKKNDGSKTNTEIQLGAGSFESFNGQASIDWSGEKHNSRVSIGHNRSGGFKTNTDFDLSTLWTESNWDINGNTLKFNGGFNSQNFGAQNFYSTRFPEQYEMTRTLNASLNWQQDIGNATWSSDLYARTNWDEFQLFREGDDYYQLVNNRFIRGADTVPSWYNDHNYHRSEVYGLRSSLNFKSKWGQTNLNVDYRYEQIRSTNLGQPLSDLTLDDERGNFTKGDQRNNISLAGEQLVTLDNLNFSAALQINYNDVFGLGLYPALNAGYRFNRQRIYASFNRSFRLPSFTELYYNIGGAMGSEDLIQEESYNYEIGYRYLSKNWHFTANLYRRIGNNIIDWTQDCDTCDLIANNTSSANFSGGEVSVSYKLKASARSAYFSNINFGFSYNQSDALDNPPFYSVYVLDYLNYKFNLRLSQKLGDRLSLMYTLSYQQREGQFIRVGGMSPEDYDRVFLVNASAQYQLKKVRLYVRAQNIGDQRYYDHANVELPGFWLSAGLNFKF